MVATGASLTERDCASAQAWAAKKDGRILAIKDSWRWLPQADAMYACDDHWWDIYVKELRTNFAGELWTQSERASNKYKINRWAGVSAHGLGKKHVHFGNNSGYQAINLAYLFGVHKIILLGFDMHVEAGKVHFFGNHPYHKQGQGPDNTVMARWCHNFLQLARDLQDEGVEVINATRSTKLTAFKQMSLEDALC